MFVVVLVLFLVVCFLFFCFFIGVRRKEAAEGR